ncbi:acriflavin resistance protein [Marispirochaeta aestuarii]|uniref:Acriflavin resistance protein n=1 Tax=Marispirochaeta aestuarii TaxID=1963862 RepID=A0A1Y1S192_9SPIO|nr:efflux RND transporter permease subunit [Marispirochaeta aestuarii]ORC36288.1 acriflavin resistance protein [Marispirochaeta aestuarii]
MILSDLSIKRPVMITMFLAALLLFGVISFLGLALNLMPEMDIPYVTVQTIYTGASPEQIEAQITRKIEDEVGTVSRIKNITSYSLDSASIMIIEFELGKDPDTATREIKDKVDSIINDLPDEADAPIVEKVDITAFPIVEVIMGGNIEATELNELADNVVKERLSRIEGVGSVSLSGGKEREIRVEFDNRVVYEKNISLTQVGQILAAANFNLPGGNFQTEGRDFSVRMEGEFETLAELSNLDIPTSAGTSKLSNIAEVRDTGATVRERTVFFDNRLKERDENTVRISIIKSPDGNAVEVAEGVREALPDLVSQLPAGVNLEVIRDESDFIQGTVDDTLSNILMGIGLTALVILFFLHDLRSTVIVALAMPMSIIPTFLIMSVMGMSLNLMSLMGLSTAVGVLVMNSVVVLENIFRHKEMGHDKRTAAARGTSEVVVAVVASTMTNVAVFLPMANMSGMAGLFLKEFAVTVVIATLFSMLISFTLTPMLASILLPEHDTKKHPIGQRLEAWFSGLESGYKRLLSLLLKSKTRSTLLIGGTLVAFVVTMLLFSRVPFEFAPFMDQGQIEIKVELPEGSNLSRSARTLEAVESRIAEFPEVKTVTTTIGSLSQIDRGTNLAVMSVALADKDERDASTVELAAEFSGHLADIPNARIRVTPVNGMGGGRGSQVSFYLQGENLAQVEIYRQELVSRLRQIPGLINVSTSTKPGTPEIVLRPDRMKLSEAGLSVQQLAMTMRAAVEGMVMTTFKERGQEYDVRVTLNDEDVSGIEEIENILLPTKAGIYPISHFAEVQTGKGINQILRVNKTTSVEFTGDLAPGYVLGEITGSIDSTVANMDMEEGVSMRWAGNAEMLQETIMDMLFVFILAVVLTYMLLAAILEKFGQPVLILSTIPLSLMGVVLAFLLTDKTMNMVSMLAIVMLVGMVVNNAILILDYANQLRAGGMNVHDAILEAAPTKLKPIIMSNLATMLGMLPMALGIGASGAEMRQPMGIVSIGGLFAATFLSLFVIPALENSIESRKVRRAKST